MRYILLYVYTCTYVYAPLTLCVNDYRRLIQSVVDFTKEDDTANIYFNI